MDKLHCHACFHPAAHMPTCAKEADQTREGLCLYSGALRTLTIKKSSPLVDPWLDMCVGRSCMARQESPSSHLDGHMPLIMQLAFLLFLLFLLLLNLTAGPPGS